VFRLGGGKAVELLDASQFRFDFVGLLDVGVAPLAFGGSHQNSARALAAHKVARLASPVRRYLAAVQPPACRHLSSSANACAVPAPGWQLTLPVSYAVLSCYVPVAHRAPGDGEGENVSAWVAAPRTVPQWLYSEAVRCETRKDHRVV